MVVDQSTETQVKAKPKPELANRKLKPNPFIAYRDPTTGRWIVVKSTAA